MRVFFDCVTAILSVQGAPKTQGDRGFTLFVPLCGYHMLPVVLGVDRVLEVAG